MGPDGPAVLALIRALLGDRRAERLWSRVQAREEVDRAAGLFVTVIDVGADVDDGAAAAAAIRNNTTVVVVVVVVVVELLSSCTSSSPSYSSSS